MQQYSITKDSKLNSENPSQLALRYLVTSVDELDLSLRNARNFVWCKPHWEYLNIDEETLQYLKQCEDLQRIVLTEDVEDIIERSREFPVPFPIQSVRLEQLKQTRPLDRLQRNIKSTYPLIHERVLLLMTRFLAFKREHGSNIEKKLYKNMSVAQLIDRLLKKRAVTFYGAYDKYMLVTGKKGRDGWESVGTLKEKPPLLLRNCLSYDEMKLSSMLFVSGYTENINDGARNNKGVAQDDIEQNAVIIGIIGPRFKRTYKMEYEDIIISKEQNVTQNGYGAEECQCDEAKRLWRKMWTEFYQFPNQSYGVLETMESKQSSKSRLYMAPFVKIPRKPGETFQNEVYYKRLCVIFECVLLEAEARARAKGKFAFVNVVGAGLGKWRVSPHQEDVFVLTFYERLLTYLQSGKLDHVSDVNFAYIKPSPPVFGLFEQVPGTAVYKNFLKQRNHPRGGINAQIHNREPSSKLTGEHEGKLLIMTYAWDGNAQPGNEFWVGLLSGSGDSAAACATQVSELHNAYINPQVAANNTMVAGRNGVITLQEYCSGLQTMQKITETLKFQNLSWYKPDWPLLSMTRETEDLVIRCKNIPDVEISDDIESTIARSSEFPIDFPIKSIRLKKLKESVPLEKLRKNIRSTYPLLHERVLLLMAHFLVHKREHGSSIEKSFYKDMSVSDLVDRILKKRAVVFMGQEDSYQLLYGATGEGGWEQVGTELEKFPLKLENCLSYDEMKLSAMVYVSGHTTCINDGNRYNRGVVNREDVETDAVIIGIIGPRLERENRMDCEDILITEKQNTVENGYGDSEVGRSKWRQLWADFYKIQSQTYSNLTSSIDIPSTQTEEQRYQNRYVKLRDGSIFDNEVYYKRLCIIAETVLLEANTRAEEDGKDAFVNVIGAGLGVWKVSVHQPDVYILTFIERIRALLEKGSINRVADVNFAYIKPSDRVLDLFSKNDGSEDKPATLRKMFIECHGHPRVQLHNREPSEKLKEEHEGKLLVMTYPWDGNAHPGNEFWIRSLDGSGDPAAASSTQVAELHNAYINHAVTGNNARIATNSGVRAINKYAFSN